MSGGVDSSVTAHLLKEAGYEVIGAHMLLSERGASNVANLGDLENVCRILGIPLHKIDFRSEFDSSVISYFCREYAAGHTPNPCVVCNKQIKFGLLLKWALENGAQYLATGHYVRIIDSPAGFHLMRAVSLENDQTYFLYRLGQHELSHMLFPLGNRISKAAVRQIAREAGLPVSEKPKSRDICFIPGGDYRAFIGSFVPQEPGNIVDTDGKILGRHQGLARYTVGQRQGLGISSGGRLYVIQLDAQNNCLIVGSKEELETHRVDLCDLSWISGKAPEVFEGIEARMRYRGSGVAVRVTLSDNTGVVRFEKPQMAVGPGQSCVFYRGEEVLGGGVIEKEK